MEDNKNPESMPCRECQVGMMHRKLVAYVTYIGDELITVPDFPAWVCDICGQREYDNNALNRLMLLLSPNAGRPTAHRPLVKKPTEVKPKGAHAGKPE
jgi:YgiT-type zinc finger domain-containing protein